MGLGVVRHLVAHPGLEREPTPILQLGLHLTLQAQQHMPLAAPVVRHIPRGVLDHAHANATKVLRLPEGLAGFGGMFGAGDFGPVGGSEGDVVHLHGGSLSM
ncbi:hypothetical protein D3C71_1912700 [compost metagenome]